MKIERTSQFLKDYKRLKKKHRYMIKLRTVIDLIVEGDTERSFRRYKNHHLQGQYKSCQGCHIEPG